VYHILFIMSAYGQPYSPSERMYSFSPDTKCYYYVYIEEESEGEGEEEKTRKMRIEFTEESIHDDEGMLGCQGYECWDKEENRYVYYCDEYGSHTMKTKTIDGDVIELVVKEILTEDEVEEEEKE